jgi:peptidoglycan hydrolase CwlO-like protein
MQDDGETNKRLAMMKRMMVAGLLSLVAGGAFAQDVPGIEICTAEKTMERRTSCLQSNVNFLKASLTKASLDSQQKIDAANRQIDALKAAVTGLQKTVADLQGQVQALGRKPDAVKDAPKAPPAKDPAAK